MSSITAADLKLGGRLTAACDAIGAGHLRRAAGIFAEISDDLNVEAEETTGLLAPEPAPAEAGEDDWSAPLPPSDATKRMAKILGAEFVPKADPQDLQMCARNVHTYGPPDPVSGWRTCSVCGNVNVAPPGDSSIDTGMRGG